MRSFGMIPVLPAFAGHIPKGLIDVHPEIKYSTQEWVGLVIRSHYANLMQD